MRYTLTDLQAACLAGQKFKYLLFWGHTAPSDGSINQSCFSQWWPCRFTVDGVEYSCTEQYMMAEKARLFNDSGMLAEIMKAKHPKTMKALGRVVQGFDNEIWEQHCYDIVKKGNLAKFSQNAELGLYLINTNKRILVEASPVDRIWGIGLSKVHPSAEDPLKWRGKNLLGFALTEVKQLLQMPQAE